MEEKWPVSKALVFSDRRHKRKDERKGICEPYI